MTDKHDFSDLTPPPELVRDLCRCTGLCFDEGRERAIKLARWGAEQAAERLKGQWPELDDDESWRPVPGHEKSYSVSSHGRIRSEARYITTAKGSRIVYEKILRQTPAKNDYLRVTLAKDGDHITALVHQVVAQAFLGPRPDGMHVLHGPLGRQCNAVSNLCYGTPSQNHGPDRLRDGTDIRGTKHGNSVLTDDDVRAIRASNETQVALAQRYGVGRTTIRHVQAGENWAWLDGSPKPSDTPRWQPSAPPTLKERALKALDGLGTQPASTFRQLDPFTEELIRRALEADS